MNSRSNRLAIALAFSVGTSAALAQDNQVPSVQSATVVDTTSGPGKPAQQPPTLRFAVQLQDVEQFQLESFDAGPYIAKDFAARDGVVTPSLRVGVSRPVLADLAAGSWQEIAGAGRIRAIQFTAPGAYALRLHLSSMDLPAGAEVWVYSPKHIERAQGPFLSAGPLGDGQVWSTIIIGEAVTVEYFVPQGVETTGSLVIDDLMHVYRNLAQILQSDRQQTREGPCHCDVTCYPDWQPLHNATCRVFFNDNGSMNTCTGTLLSTLNGDFTPYLYTANHCVSSQAAAQTLTAWWFYQTSVCNGAPPDLSAVPTSNVADFLSGQSYFVGPDFTFLMVKGALPDGLTWAGWDTVASLPANAPGATIHHPTGAYKRIFFNTINPYTVPTGLNPAYFWQIQATSCGTVEFSTSGSPVYRQDNHLFIGSASHATALPVDCTNNGPFGYGRFGVAYSLISGFLAGGSDDNFDAGAGDDTCATAATVTPGTFSSLIVKKNDEDWYKIALGPFDTIDITSTFTNANGDIDLELYSTCGGSPVASSHGSGDSETISYVNQGAAALYLRVYLAGSVRNTYGMTISLRVCPGDLNGDRQVDLSDLATLLQHYGTAGGRTDGDIDGSGFIDLTDLSLLLAYYGQVCP